MEWYWYLIIVIGSIITLLIVMLFGFWFFGWLAMKGLFDYIKKNGL